MKIGTKSVLFGSHCFFLHPWFVAWGWWKLYGVKRIYIGYRTGYPGTWRWKLGFRGGPVFASLFTSLPLWVAFCVHDIGYLGKPNMDGLEGETHPMVGARLMMRLFERPAYRRACSTSTPSALVFQATSGPWGAFVLYHSRYYAKGLRSQPSRLCFADKMAIVLTPWWLYLPMARASGEIAEYRRMALVRDGNGPGADEKAWWLGVQAYCRAWIDEHKNGRADTWTKV